MNDLFELSDDKIPCISMWQPWAQWVMLGWKTKTRFPWRLKVLGSVFVLEFRVLQKLDEPSAVIECETRRFGIILESVRQCEPFAFRSMQGIFRVQMPNKP